MSKRYKGVKGELCSLRSRSYRGVKGTILLPLKDIRPFHSILTSLLFLLTTLLSLSCSDDNDTPYPSIITELADCPTDAQGTMSSIVLDDDTRLTLSNPKTGLKPSVTYRALVGYTLGNDGYATLYSAKPATLLKDSTDVGISDPTNIVSIWRTGRYINLHLLPKTQGGNQTWGYIVERIEGQHAYLRLHHRQGSDPISYSTDQYASLPLDLVPATRITLRIETFQGTWEREL